MSNRPGHPSSPLQTIAYALLAAAIGLAFTAGVYAELAADRRDRLEAGFAFDAAQRTELVREAFAHHGDALESIKRFFENSSGVTNGEFTRFASAWASVKGFRSLVWAVPDDGSDGNPPGGGELRPVYRVPTLDSDAELAWLGLSAVRSAVAEARVSGRMNASELFELGDARYDPFVALCLPVYAAWDESGVRRFGLVIGLVSLPTVSNALISPELPTGLPFSIRDYGAGPGAPEYRYASRIGAMPPPGHQYRRLSYPRILDFSGRSWFVEVRASTGYVSGVSSDAGPEFFLFAGALASFVLGFAVHSLSRSRARAEASAAAAGEEAELFFQLGPDMFMITELDGRIRRLNSEWTASLGYRVGELEGYLLIDFIHPDDREESIRVCRGVGDGIALEGYVNRVRTAAGDYRRVEWRARRAPGGGAVFVGARDVTERESMEERLRGSLVEREALIKEVHHRVKNNMQVISSLLELGSMDEADARFTAVAKEARGRIRSMALVHEQLYKRDSISNIDLGEYLRELAGRVVGEFASGAVDLVVDAGVVPLDIDAAIPCGLVVNELVTNALKYAGAGGRRASLRISAREEGGWCSVAVEDDGPGFPDGAFERSMAGATLGLSLVSGLASQLRGELRASSGPGARVELRFPLAPRGAGPGLADSPSDRPVGRLADSPSDRDRKSVV